MSSVFFREAGAGPGAVWLAPKFHVLAPDLYGAGKSPPRPEGAGLRDEARFLEPVFAAAGDPFSLVAHSYSGALALVAAALHPRRLRAMALYEPNLFALVERESPSDVDGIRNAVSAAVAALQSGDSMAAARIFIDFWMGAGSFDRMPEKNKPPIAAAVADVQAWKDALFDEPTPLSAFAALDIPVLLLVGKRSPLSSRAVADRLAQTLPRVERVDLDGLGHMAPVTHPDVVNARIAAFLDQRGR